MSVTGFSLEHVSHLYGDKIAVDDVSMHLPLGTTTAILGPSGCGKTTLLRLLAGLESPAKGLIRLDGQVVSTEHHILVPPHRRDIAMVFQDLALWPNLSAAQNVILGMTRLGLDRRAREQRALDALAACGIGDLSRRKPAQLSGGQQQRVAIARAVAAQPRFLLLDEPFTSLDLLLKHQLLADLSALSRSGGFTLVLVTHDPLEATALCERALVLEEGRLVESGSLMELLDAPASRFLSTFREQLSRFRDQRPT